MQEKTLSDFQKEVKTVVDKFGFNWSNYVEYIHLVEEVAEFGEALTVKAGDREAGSGEKAKADHSDPKEELGDILFTVLQFANMLNLDASQVLEDTFKHYDKKLENLKADKK